MKNKATSGISLGTVIIFIALMSVIAATMLFMSSTSMRQARIVPESDSSYFNAEALRNRATASLLEYTTSPSNFNDSNPHMSAILNNANTRVQGHGSSLNRDKVIAEFNSPVFKNLVRYELEKFLLAFYDNAGTESFALNFDFGTSVSLGGADVAAHILPPIPSSSGGTPLPNHMFVTVTDVQVSSGPPWYVEVVPEITFTSLSRDALTETIRIPFRFRVDMGVGGFSAFFDTMVPNQEFGWNALDFYDPPAASCGCTPPFPTCTHVFYCHPWSYFCSCCTCTVQPPTFPRCNTCNPNHPICTRVCTHPPTPTDMHAFAHSFAYQLNTTVMNKYLPPFNTLNWPLSVPNDGVGRPTGIYTFGGLFDAPAGTAAPGQKVYIANLNSGTGSNRTARLVNQLLGLSAADRDSVVRIYIAGGMGEGSERVNQLLDFDAWGFNNLELVSFGGHTHIGGAQTVGIIGPNRPGNPLVVAAGVFSINTCRTAIPATQPLSVNRQGLRMHNVQVVAFNADIVIPPGNNSHFGNAAFYMGGDVTIRGASYSTVVPTGYTVHRSSAERPIPVEKAPNFDPGIPHYTLGSRDLAPQFFAGLVQPNQPIPNGPMGDLSVWPADYYGIYMGFSNFGANALFGKASDTAQNQPFRVNGMFMGINRGSTGVGISSDNMIGQNHWPKDVRFLDEIERDPDEQVDESSFLTSFFVDAFPEHCCIGGLFDSSTGGLGNGNPEIPRSTFGHGSSGHNRRRN